MNVLKNLTNTELENSLKTLVEKERKLLHVILQHIKEVERRKLYLEKAYSSIYEYLIKNYGYSGSAAMRRIEAARLLREVPEVSQKIAEGSINLSQIGELSRAVKEKERSQGGKVTALQKAELVSLISGKTTKETQKELSFALDIDLKEPERQRVQKDDSVRLEITLTQAQYQKIMRCKDQLAHILQQQKRDSSTASVLEAMADQCLNQKNTTSSVTASVPTRINKMLTPKMKKLVIARDRCCQYQDPLTGKLCGSTFALQTDHRISRWANGDHSPENLQVLCRQHNNFKYKKEAGIRLL